MTLEPATINILIGSGITLLGVLITNVFQFWRDRFQWQKQQKLERERWERDQLLEIYRNCISSITAYLQSRHSVTLDPKLPYPAGVYGSGMAYNSELYGQAEAWLALLLIYHPAKETQEYIDFENEVKALERDTAKLRQLLDKVVVIARTDSRLLASASTGARVK
jgi:hypothetical protein